MTQATTADSMTPSKVEFTPYIPASKSLPEITWKATILSILLTVVMAGSNAYLGLKIGMTVSATIPAAVMSMAILRFFKNSNILENNIVQTAASAGEATAAAVVFTIPALLLMGYWANFPFFTTFSITVIGGTLGVLFSIPLRRALVVESDLKFPEGVATAEVLKAGDGDAKGRAKDLLMGGILGGLVKLGQSAFMVVEECVGCWIKTSKTVLGASAGFSLVLVGAGYMVGLRVGIAMIVGAIIGWGIGVPLYGHLYGMPDVAEPIAAAKTIWKEHIRIMGVGTMVVGGLWTLVKLVDPIKRAVKFSIDAFARAKRGEKIVIQRTEYDIPMTYVLGGIALLTLPLIYVFHDILSCCNLGLTPMHHWMTVIVITVFAVIFGFIASAIAGYMAGLVGSSHNPVSAVTIIGILSISVVLLFMLGGQIDFVNDAVRSVSAAALSIVVAAVMCNASAISGDNLQDLKSGQIVGATPWKQEIILILGTVVGALAIAPILEILYQAYGIGTAFPREGMDPSHALNAPTAMIMTAITKAVYTNSLEWKMFGIGVGIAFLLILWELSANKTGKTFLPVIPVAMGIYLPIDIAFPTFVGGLIAYMADKRLDEQRKSFGVRFQEAAEGARKRGLLFSSGLIAGEALMGIALAIPFAISQRTDIFSIRPEGFDMLSIILGAGSFFAVALYLFRICSTCEAEQK